MPGYRSIRCIKYLLLLHQGKKHLAQFKCREIRLFFVQIRRREIHLSARMETQMIEAIGMEIVVESASELKKSKMAPKTRAFALCFIHGAGKHGRRLLEHTTAVDRENGRNPSWNEAISFALPESALQQDGLLFTVQIFNQRTWSPNVIGRVTVPLKDLAKQMLENGESFQVLSPSGKPKGTLNISVKLSNKTKIHVHQFLHPRSHAVIARGNDLCAQTASTAIMMAGISSSIF